MTDQKTQTANAGALPPETVDQLNGPIRNHTKCATAFPFGEGFYGDLLRLDVMRNIRLVFRRS